MATDVEKLLETFDALRKEANVNACFGEPVTIEGRTVIPIAKVGYGLGMGVGQGPAIGSDEALKAADTSAEGSGGGGGMVSSPLGVIEVTSEGTRVEPVIDEQRVAIVAMIVAAWTIFWLARALMAIFGRRE